MIDLNALSLPQVFEALTRDGLLHRALEIARDEDLGPRGLDGDVTSLSIVPAGSPGAARVAVREAGVTAGLAAAPMIFEVFGGGIEWRVIVPDGERVSPGAVVGELRGSALRLLAVERTLLNVLGRCCGIATATRAFVDAIGPAPCAVCETRKTAPGLRALDKYSARCGGAHLHRIGLFDAAMFKDNHLAGIGAGELAARLSAAAERARAQAPDGLRFVAAEADTLEQLDSMLALPRGVLDVALLDNMSVESLREAVRRRNAKNPALLLEASGGVRLDTVRTIAETGVDRVSVGAITHSAPALDVGLDWA